MVEQKDGGEDQSFIFNNILPEQHVKAFKEVAGEFGVKIRILASAGETYRETRLDQQGNKYTHEEIIPKGSLKVEISSTTKNLNRFYDKAAQVLVKMETSRF